MDASVSRRPGTLRLKLVAAFALVSVPPLVLLAAAVILLVERAFDDAVNQRLVQGLKAAENRVESLERRAATEVTAIAEDLTGGGLPGDVAPRLAEQHQLDVLELLDAEERVLSSRHWPAGFGLPDRDGTYAGAPAMRLEKAAEDYGAAEHLTVTAAHGVPGAPIRVRGGFLLDDGFWSELHELLGLEVGLWDARRRTFVTRSTSPLARWSPPAPNGEGVLGPGGASHRWTSSAFGRELTLYVAAPRGEWDALSRRVRGLSLAFAGVSLMAAVAFGLILARRIARPAGALAEAAGRVAAGDLDVQAPVMGDDELAGLARAFNRMTSDLRTAQERLVQAERVAAWREIARRLAHELKNPIFPIALSMETVQRAFSGVALPAPGGTDLTKLLRESTQTTLDELRRLQRVVDEFSAFARMPQPQIRPADLNAVVREVAALYQARAAGVRVEMHLEPELPEVAADPDLLIRAVSNLLANALEATPDGGTLHLRTVVREDGIAVEVQDSGPGLTEEQKARLFTPYFTTKPGGTGLGLAIVQGIASDHGGRVDVRPAVPRGTVFALVLPATKP
jgi:two-component system, NtrC family, nitrogen regulation sensor histidine kinase NtrY